MSDIPTHATGVHVIGNHAYLYDRNGAYIADHMLADSILGAFTLDRNATDNRDAAEQWLDTIGYRLPADDQGWVDHHGWLRAVEYIGPVSFHWGMTSPGHYHGRQDRRPYREATVHRTREGMVGASGVMWTVVVDGRHISNEGTRAEGWAAADRELRRLSAVVVPDPDEPGDVDLHAPASGGPA